MEIIDINSFEPSQVYIMYESYKSIAEDIKKNENKTDQHEKKIALVKLQLNAMETWANENMYKKLNWTKEEILLNYGNKPTLILHFHPTSESYLKYGKELVVNAEFKEDELFEMLQNIRAKAERKSGQISFKQIPNLEIGTLATRDIFSIEARLW